MLHGEDIDLPASAGATAAASGAPTWRCRRWRTPTSTPRRCSSIGLGSPWSEPVLGDVKAGGAGAAAGLKPGDRIVAIDGVAIDDASQVIARDPRQRQDRRGDADAVALERGAARLEIVVTPAVVLDEGNRVGRIGAYVGRRPSSCTVRYGPIEGL